MDELLKYEIGITLIPGIGDVLAKNLINYCGGVEAVFREKKENLRKIRGIGEVLANSVSSPIMMKRVEEELRFLERYKIKPLFYTNQKYPQRLHHCYDAPVLLYYKGNTDLNSTRILSVVGTRSASHYGKELCEKLIDGLAEYGVLIVSGMAYGIDICAHKSALQKGLPTVGVMAHGLDKIYPGSHRSVAEKMIQQGGLLTEFMSRTIPEGSNFPKRNRIVAGISDATVVVESRSEGGSLITSDIANSYNKDVFTFPGRVNDSCSTGCNRLIKYNRAALIESAEDVIRHMGWSKPVCDEMVDQKVTIGKSLSAEEKSIIAFIKKKEKAGFDELCNCSRLSGPDLSLQLLNLELKGNIVSLPGKIYALKNG